MFLFFFIVFFKCSENSDVTEIAICVPVYFSILFCFTFTLLLKFERMKPVLFYIFLHVVLQKHFTGLDSRQPEPALTL